MPTLVEPARTRVRPAPAPQPRSDAPAPSTAAVRAIHLTIELGDGADEGPVLRDVLEALRAVAPAALQSGAVRVASSRNTHGPSLDRARRAALVEGIPVALTFLEFELLDYLVSRPGRLLSRAELLGAVWGESYGGGSRTLDVHVSRLRRKLGDAGLPLQCIRRVGYRWDDAEARPAPGTS